MENMLVIIFVLAIVFLATLLITGIIKHYALSYNLVDIPNERSSHTIDTPRGGGLAFVITFLLALVVCVYLQIIDTSFFVGISGAGLLASSIGFIDDHKHIAACRRLLVHFIAAGWLILILGGLPPLPIFGVIFDLAWIGYVLAGLYLVWLLNLYNFMDGIDGIASVEAVTVCIGGIVLYVLVGATSHSLVAPMLLLAAVTGFLFWNYPRAKIFMGDAGSGFLGIMLGGFSIQAAWIVPKLFWCWLILLGVFLVDATITLLQRALKREKIYVAHRSHAYQHAARKYSSHICVSVGVGLINLLWLLPIAILVALNYLDGIVGVIIAYIPLIILAIYFQAGIPEKANSGHSK